MSHGSCGSLDGRVALRAVELDLGGTIFASLLFVGVYVIGKPLLGRIARSLSRRPAFRRLPESESYSVIRTILVVSLQAVTLILTITFVPYLRWQNWDPAVLLALIPAGVLLGIAEMSSSIVLSEYLIAGHNELARRSGRLTPVPPMIWLDSSRAGWMGQLNTASRVLPRPLGGLLVWLQVGGEEVMFRHCIPLLCGGGPVAFVIGGVLFVGMQAIGMPRIRSAAFPLLGATIMAVVHAYLYAVTGSLVPLVIAHATSFFVASRNRK